MPLISLWMAGYCMLLLSVFWLLRLVHMLTCPIHTAHCHIKPLNIKNQYIALFFNWLIKSLSIAKFSQPCAITLAVIPCVSEYKDSLVKLVCVGNLGFLAMIVFFFLFFLSPIQKAVSKWVAKRSLAICVVKFLMFLDKCPVRGIFKIYATFKITGAKKALFFSAFLSKSHSLTFLSLLSPFSWKLTLQLPEVVFILSFYAYSGIAGEEQGFQYLSAR